MADGWGQRGLKARCAALHAACLEYRAATEQEMAEYAPGGPENDEAGVGAWIVYYAQLVRLLGRTEASREQAALDAALARQLARQPVTVRLSDGTPRSVYPQSYHALRFLDTLDREVVLITRAAGAANVDTADGAAIATVAPLLESLAVRLWAWILTHNGQTETGLPFADDGEAPEPPDWTKTLVPSDLLALATAHAQVNHRDLQIIAAAFPADHHAQPSRLTLAGFIGTASDSLGVRPAEAMRRWSLGELFAQRVTAAEAARAAAAKAKPEAA